VVCRNDNNEVVGSSHCRHHRDFSADVSNCPRSVWSLRSRRHPFPSHLSGLFVRKRTGKKCLPIKLLRKLKMSSGRV
jgi:hypothetical protein